MHSRWRTPISASSFQPKVNLISRQNRHRLFFASLVKWNIHSFYLLCSTQIKKKMKNSFRNHFDTKKKVSKRSNVDMTQKNIKRLYIFNICNRKKCIPAYCQMFAQLKFLYPYAFQVTNWVNHMSKFESLEKYFLKQFLKKVFFIVRYVSFFFLRLFNTLVFDYRQGIINS